MEKLKGEVYLLTLYLLVYISLVYIFEVSSFFPLGISFTMKSRKDHVIVVYYQLFVPSQ